MSGVKGRSGGHNRRTQAHKELAGTARKSRAPKGPAADEIGAPAKPLWLDQDGIASEAWDRSVRLLLERGTLTPGDRDAVLLAAKAESEFRRCDEILLREGLTVATEKGLSTHPLVKVRESAWRRWSSAIAVLGLQPVMRDRIAKARAAERGNRFANV